jgi:hypothetical protein
MTREEELVKEGWEKQTAYDEPRLSEIVEMYREMDLEVHLEPFDSKGEPGCAECMISSPERFKTIYTRKEQQ